MVEVCAICDIAGCHHIRSRAAMTDPTPTRAEVEAHDLAEQGRHAISALWQRCETLTAQRNALRERAEAAEAERDRQYDENVNRIAMQARAENERDAARRAEAAAWNDAIEAAAGVAEQYRDCWPRATAPDAQYELKQEYLHMAYAAKIVGEQVRALTGCPHGGRGMSAPRKIWAYPNGHWGCAKLGWGEFAHAYQHDDVVRELSGIASHAIDQWESCIESEYAGTSSYDYMIAEVQERRAALAKIAQEG